MTIQRVHVVAKTHLDLGFTALAAEVEEQYLASFFPRAIEVAASLRDRRGPERLTWTTGSWIVRQALADPNASRSAAVADAVRAGTLAWHALPVTTHTELMDAALFRHGLSISRDLDGRFDRRTTAAKMTDVPGHTRGIVPLLAGAGVTFLHLGVNPAWPIPDVPPVFRWRALDGSEVTVAYQAGGYGGDVVVDGCADVLAFLHAGDNLGPPSVDDVLAAHAELRHRYPGADVVASTLDAFARALAAFGAEGRLPVVTAEIGDPWLFGAGSDPQKVAALRERLRARPDAAELDRLLLVTEHTWGLDQKVALPEDRRWGADDLVGVRSSAEGQRFEASWAEQRAYLGPSDPSVASRPPRLAAPLDAVGAEEAGFRRVAVDEVLEPDGWSCAVGADGSLRRLVSRADGRVLADGDSPLGLLRFQSFDESDYERFYAQLTPTADDEWWARWDNT